MSLRKQRYREPVQVTFCAYPKLVFAWPLILMGLVFYAFAGPEAGEGVLKTLGWIYLVGAALVLLTLGVDLERNYAAFWFAIFVAVFFLGRWLEDVRGITVVGDLYRWFSALDVRYDRGFGMAMSVLLGIPYVVMLVWARIQHRWRLTHNEFEHFSWGRVDDSLARGAKRVRTTYPDLMELVLLGAGTLIVSSASGQTELRRIHHVPLLPLLRRRIDRILASSKVTVATEQAVLEDEYEGEDGARSPSPENRARDSGEEKL